MIKNNTYTAVGSIHFVDLGPEVDHRIAKVRPCVIVENDRATVSVYAFTDDDGYMHYSEIPIPKGIGNLKKNSKLKLGQTITVDRCRVGDFLGELPEEYLTKIEIYIKEKGIVKKLNNIIQKRIVQNLIPLKNK